MENLSVIMDGKPKESARSSIGKIGEDIACDFLRSKGYTIIDRNYRRPWGELDIVSKKHGKFHFVEVKTVSCEINNDVTRETPPCYGHRPEDNVHRLKLKRISRVIQSYCADKKISDSEQIQLDIISIFLDVSKKTARIRRLKDIIIE